MFIGKQSRARLWILWFDNKDIGSGYLECWRGEAVNASEWTLKEGGGRRRQNRARALSLFVRCSLVLGGWAAWVLLVITLCSKADEFFIIVGLQIYSTYWGLYIWPWKHKQICNVFPTWGEVKGRLKLFSKFIRFETQRLPYPGLLVVPKLFHWQLLRMWGGGAASKILIQLKVPGVIDSP